MKRIVGSMSRIHSNETKMRTTFVSSLPNENPGYGSCQPPITVTVAGHKR